MATVALSTYQEAIPPTAAVTPTPTPINTITNNISLDAPLIPGIDYTRRDEIMDRLDLVCRCIFLLDRPVECLLFGGVNFMIIARL